MNSAQPTSSPLPDISVITPLTQAIDRVKRVLFQPFDILVDQTRVNDFKPFGSKLTKIQGRKIDKS